MLLNVNQRSLTMVGESWDIFIKRVLVQYFRYHLWKSRGGTALLCQQPWPFATLCQIWRTRDLNSRYPIHLALRKLGDCSVSSFIRFYLDFFLPPMIIYFPNMW